jgi:aquaporin NIP
MTETKRRTMATEAFGTFALVFAGAGAIVINEVSGGAITHVGIAITFGPIAVPAMAAGPISGAAMEGGCR